MNYIPAPKSIELHLSPSPEFSRYSKKVKALPGGQYSECRGNSHQRYVQLPWTAEGRALANKLVAEFGHVATKLHRGTVIIARGVPGAFRGKHVHAHVVVQYIDKTEADPCGKFLAKYEAAFLRAFPEATEPEPVVAPAPKVLREFLDLNNGVKFWAVLEALQQYIDNGNDCLDGDAEFDAKIAAAETFRDQLDAALASLAD